MRRFEIYLSGKAQSDADNLRFAIVFKFRAPLTAKRYLQGLNKKMQSLRIGADAIQVDEELSKQHGFDIRRTYYKEMTILYTIEDANVYIIRIMPQSLIIF